MNLQMLWQSRHSKHGNVGKQLFRVAQHSRHTVIISLEKRLVAIWILISHEPWSFLCEKSRSNMGGLGVAFTPSEQQGKIHLCQSSQENYSFSQTCQASGGKSKPVHHGIVSGRSCIVELSGGHAGRRQKLEPLAICHPCQIFCHTSLSLLLSWSYTHKGSAEQRKPPRWHVANLDIMRWRCSCNLLGFEQWIIGGLVIVFSTEKWFE